MSIEKPNNPQSGEKPSVSPLPFGHELYFERDENTLELPLSELTPIRKRREGVLNAAVKMAEAANGMRARRAPISVFRGAGGAWTIKDGNSTYEIARLSGWPTILCQVVSE